MTETTWAHVVAMEGVIGGELEYKRGRNTYRGKISRTEELGEGLLFHFEWLNELTRRGLWFPAPNNPLGISKQLTKPYENGDDRIEFDLLTLEHACIYKVRAKPLAPQADQPS